MTIAELYTWAIENDVENCLVEIQYADGGGFHYGTRDLEQSDITVETRSYGEVVVL